MPVRRLSALLLLALPALALPALLAPRAPVVGVPAAEAAEGARPDLGTEEQRAAGKVVYDTWCGQCHADDGAGEGIAASRLLPAPRDFTSGKYKFRSTPFGALPTDDDLRRTIRDGLPYTGMPGFPDLSDTEVRDLLYYLKGFSPAFQNPSAYAEPMAVPDPPGFDVERAEAGFETYVATGCARCHGEEGRGDGMSAPTLRDDWGEFVRVADLTMPWTFRGGATRRDVYRTISTGISGTPMAGFTDEALPPEKKWEIVDWIVAQAGGEGGEAPYSRLVEARPVDGEIELGGGLGAIRAIFADAPRAMFPVIGQVVQPGRAFHPAARAVEVRAVYNRDEVALLVEWHDMTLTASGENRPDLPVGLEDEAAGAGGPGAAGGAAGAATAGTASDEEPETDIWGQPVGPAAAPEAAPAPADDLFGVVADTAAPAVPETPWSDAVAVQLPAELREGVAKPYFLFGDVGYPVELWHVDLARPASAAVWEGRGSGALTRLDREPPATFAAYEDGRWSVAFVQARLPGAGVRFPEDAFVPIALTVWDGFHAERGNLRGLTSWYHLYLPPLERPSPVGPMLRAGLGVLGLELLVIWLVRRRFRRAPELRTPSSEPAPEAT